MLLLLLAALQASGDGIVLLPGDFVLDGPYARQTLVVEERRGGRFTGEVPGAELSAEPAGIVRLENGTASPLADGQAVVRARAGGRESSVRVVVRGMGADAEPNFRNQVQPLLARFGCSGGPCHGAAAGKAGFRLSLRGYDDEGDHVVLTRHALGRRIDLEDPARSLLLRKPTGSLPHKGGVKFSPGEPAYRLLADWIAAGVPGPREADPRIERIEVVPPAMTLKPGDLRQVVVLAHFSDGSVKDATPWAKFTGSDSSVAVPDDDGRVKVVGHGQGAVTAWYLSKIAIATVTVPYPATAPPEAFTKAPRRNFIDERSLEKLRELNLPPSPRSTDAEFLRRAHLDTIGVLPTVEETRAFLADARPDKRDRLIDALLARPEWVDYWTYKWSDLLLVNTKRLPGPVMWAYHTWIRNRIAVNTPWDRFAREIVTARGGVLQNGNASFFLLQDDPTEMAETTSQVFLGMTINCAKCHNHPMEKWTNDQYYGFASLFARVRAKAGSRPGDTVIFTAADGELVQPLSNRPQAPAPLDAAALDPADPRDRREALADWLVDPANPYFSRSIVNRVWANFFGTGLVEAVDDLRLTNPASDERLLGALADHLVAEKYDLKALMRSILRSETYQRSSTPVPGNEADRRFYSRYYPRRLMAEVALDALSQVTGAPTEFFQAAERGKGSFAYPVGWRALQLPDSNVDSYFLKSFGRADRIIPCECERTSEPSMSQALHMANGDTLNQKLRSKTNRISKLIESKASDEAVIEDLILAALSRTPTPEERARFGEILAGAKDVPRRELLEDLFWGVLSSREFLFTR